MHLCAFVCFLLDNLLTFYPLQPQIRNVFGGAHHAPHAQFVKVSKMHNNGHVLLFMRPSECRMGGYALQLMRVMRLKNVIEECTASKVFLDEKKFHFIKEVTSMEVFWDVLFGIIQLLYPLYRLLRLCDMQRGCIDKVKFYVMQVDRLLEPGLDNTIVKLESMDDKFDVVVENSKKSTKGKAKKKAANLKTEGLAELGKFCVPF